MSDAMPDATVGSADGGLHSRRVGAADGSDSISAAPAAVDGSSGAGVGRRADDPVAKRSIVKSVKFNDAEWAQVERIAKRRGIAPSTLLRAAALDLDDDRRLRSVKTAEVAPPASPEIEALRDELRDLRVQYKGSASNLNQLTRLSNIAGSALPRVVVDGQSVALVDLLVETRDAARLVLTNLGALGHA